MTSLPENYPFAAAPTATLLEWAHMAAPPHDEMRKAAPWPKHEGEFRGYLDGMIEGRVHFWRYGALFPSSDQ